MQNFNYKLYDKDLNFKKVINPNLISSDINFTCQKNWWQGALLFSLSYVDDDINFWDIIKVFTSSLKVVNKLLYTWYIDEIDKFFDTGEWMTINAIWLWSNLNNIILKNSWWSRTFSITKKASEIITDIVNFANSIDNRITIWEIQETTWNINVRFDNNNCFTSLLRVVENTPWFYFYIDENWKVNFKEQSNNINYYTTFQRDLQSYQDDGRSDIINKIYFSYDWWEKEYIDNASIAKYWIKEKTWSDLRINNEATADKFVERFFNENANPKENRRLVINREFKGKKTLSFIWNNAYRTWDSSNFTWDDAENIEAQVWIEFIEPWETIKILNFKKEVSWIIEKLEFKKDFVILLLNKNYNFISLIKE